MLATGNLFPRAALSYLADLDLLEFYNFLRYRYQHLNKSGLGVSVICRLAQRYPKSLILVSCRQPNCYCLKGHPPRDRRRVGHSRDLCPEQLLPY